jgi:hypothetical protein
MDSIDTDLYRISLSSIRVVACSRCRSETCSVPLLLRRPLSALARAPGLRLLRSDLRFSCEKPTSNTSVPSKKNKSTRKRWVSHSRACVGLRPLAVGKLEAAWNWARDISTDFKRSNSCEGTQKLILDI